MSETEVKQKSLLEQFVIVEREKGEKKSKHKFTLILSFPPQKECVVPLEQFGEFCFANDSLLPPPEKVERGERSKLLQLLYSTNSDFSEGNKFVFLVRGGKEGRQVFYVSCILSPTELSEVVPSLHSSNSALPNSPTVSNKLNHFFHSSSRAYCIVSPFPFFSLHFKVLQLLLQEIRSQKALLHLQLDFFSPPHSSPPHSSSPHSSSPHSSSPHSSSPHSSSPHSSSPHSSSPHSFSHSSSSHPQPNNNVSTSPSKTSFLSTSNPNCSPFKVMEEKKSSFSFVGNKPFSPNSKHKRSHSESHNNKEHSKLHFLFPNPTFPHSAQPPLPPPLSHPSPSSFSPTKSFGHVGNSNSNPQLYSIKMGEIGRVEKMEENKIGLDKINEESTEEVIEEEDTTNSDTTNSSVEQEKIEEEEEGEKLGQEGARPNEEKVKLLEMEKKEKVKLLEMLEDYDIPKERLLAQRNVKVGPKTFKFASKEYEEEEYMIAKWCLPLFLWKVPFISILKLVACALLEKRVVLVSQNLRLLSCSVLSVVSLLKPFNYQSLVLPIMAPNMVDMLDAPVPFIVGCVSGVVTKWSPSNDLFVLNLDNSEWISPLHTEFDKLIPPLPFREKLNVKSTIRALHNSIVSRNKEEKNTLKKTQQFNSTSFEKTQHELTFLCYAQFNSYLSSLMLNFARHCVRDKTNPSKTVSIFLSDSFIISETRNEDEVRFFKLFFETQIFQEFSERNRAKEETNTKKN